MADFRLRVTLPYETGLPSDVAINDFSISGVGTPGAGTLGAITDFYRTAAGANGPVGQFLSPELSRATNACRVDAFDRAAAPGAPPVSGLSFTLPAPLAGGVMPEEVAVCLSMHADLTPAGINKARRRGRIFIGPIMAAGISWTSPGPVRVSTNLQGALCDSAAQLLADLSAAGAQWDVFSTVDGVGRAVVGGWVDDALDTLRSRGPKALSRLTW